MQKFFIFLAKGLRGYEFHLVLKRKQPSKQVLLACKSTFEKKAAIVSFLNTFPSIVLDKPPFHVRRK